MDENGFFDQITALVLFCSNSNFALIDNCHTYHDKLYDPHIDKKYYNDL